MKIKKTTTVELTADDIREAIKKHLKDKGVEVQASDIKFVLKEESDTSDIDDRHHSYWYVLDKAVCDIIEVG